MDMFRTLSAAGLGTTGAAVSTLETTDPATQRAMLRLLEGTGVSPDTLTYAQTGMSPFWAFITVATIGMGPHFAAAMRRYMEDRSADKTRRLEAELNGLIERGPKDNADE